MISIKSNHEIELMRKAGEIVGNTHNYLKNYIKPGITTKELDTLANDFILKSGATPSFKGLYGFPGAICISVNDEIVHGIPGKRKLKNGDIVTLDIGACYKGYHGDSAWTYPVGNIRPEIAELLNQTEESLFSGLSVIKEGIHLGEISNAIETTARKYKLGIVKELVGHGIGTEVHQQPDIPNYGKKNTGPILKEGMTLAIEPMLNMGSADVAMLDDDWTIVTMDELPSAHFEHTVLVTKDGYEILTKR
ncbi:MAG: type I methionyl aminopeptidase [Bacilli bacterium]|nr:type I methionyl aminopeptidase [Bacilli bacterium]